MPEDDRRLADLLQRARHGDAPAIGELLDIHRDYLRALARQQVNQKMQARLDASDLVQQTCLSVYRQMTEFDGSEPAQFVAWLKRIHDRNIRNAVRNQHRAKRDAGREQTRGNTEPGQAGQASPSQQAIRGEEAVRLAQALDRLPEEEREVLRLRYFEGLTLVEIAQRLDLTKDALVWLMQRAMRRLKGEIGDTGE